MKIKVRVHPKAKNKKIEKDKNGMFQVYTVKEPVEGKANEEVVKMVSEYFEVKPNQVFINFGNKSKEKIIEIMTDLE
jgi:uncharacterized protein (TIGR00251 family)